MGCPELQAANPTIPATPLTWKLTLNLSYNNGSGGGNGPQGLRYQCIGKDCPAYHPVPPLPRSASAVSTRHCHAPGLWVGVPGQCRAHPAEITLLRPAGVPCPNRWPHLTSAIGDLTNLDKGSLLPGPVIRES
ncbi:hypothetical protein ABBQ38_014487 [Trebouxia sp. C0009 RCD-2024]